MPRGAPFRALTEDFLAHLRVERGLSANTDAAYRRDLGRYLDYLAARGRTEPDAIGPDDVRDFLTALATGSDGGAAMSPTSVARILSAVRGWHRFAHAEGAAARDVARDVRPPKTPLRLPDALSVDDVGLLIETAARGDGPLALRDRALVELLYGTGARVSEACDLAVDDVDFAAEAIRLFGKGRKERIVPMGSYLADALGAYLTRARPELLAHGAGSAFVFVNAWGKPLTRQAAGAVLRRLAEAAGLGQPVTPHSLRHSYATHLLAGGTDVRLVQELLGHADVATTQIYTHVTIDHLREVYATSHPRAR